MDKATQYLVAFFVCHAVASAACFAAMSAGPVIMYFFLVLFGIAFYGDMGGPLNFILVPAFSVLIAVAGTLAYFVIAAVLQQIRERYPFRWWLPPAAASVLALLAVGSWFLPTIESRNDVAPALFLAGFIVMLTAGAFSLYWICLLLCSFALRRVLGFSVPGTAASSP